MTPNRIARAIHEVRRRVRLRLHPPRCYDCGCDLKGPHLVYQRIYPVLTTEPMRFEEVTVRLCRGCATTERVNEMRSHGVAS